MVLKVTFDNSMLNEQDLHDSHDEGDERRSRANERAEAYLDLDKLELPGLI